MSYTIPPGESVIDWVVIEDDPRDAVVKPSDMFLEGARGVIHVGASIGQESQVYRHFGLQVAWIEAVPQIYRELRRQVGRFEHQCFNYLVTNEDDAEYDFGIASNGQSSSIFDMADHSKVWPEVRYVGAMKLRSAKLDTIIYRHSLQWADVLVMDVQGAELKVLEGCRDYLDQFRFIKAEAADFNIYEGGCTLADLDRFLRPNYKRVDTPGMHVPEVGFVCDALYRRLI